MYCSDRPDFLGRWSKWIWEWVIKIVWTRTHVMGVCVIFSHFSGVQVFCR